MGLIGCGVLARAAHIPSLLRIPGVHLTALSDCDPAALRAAAQMAPGAQALASHTGLMELVDAVVIASPPAAHLAQTLDAIERNLHVYLEKPMAASLDEARQLEAAWRGTNRVGALGFNYRFNALLGQMRDALEAGRAGEPLAVRSVFSLAAHTVPAWKQKRASGGGVLLDLASHHADLARFLFRAEVAEVSAETRSVRTEQDCATLTMTLDSGVSIQSFFSLCAFEEDSWDVFGAEARLRVNRYASQRLEILPLAKRAAQLAQIRHGVAAFLPSRWQSEKLRSPWHEPSFPHALRAFIEAVRPGGTRDSRLATFADGLRAMSIIDAAETSATTGRRTQCQK